MQKVVTGQMFGLAGQLALERSVLADQAKQRYVGPFPVPRHGFSAIQSKPHLLSRVDNLVPYATLGTMISACMLLPV